MRVALIVGLVVVCFGVQSHSADLPESVVTAINLKKEVASKNQEDLKHLWDIFQPEYKKLKDEAKPVFIGLLKEKLQADKAAFRVLRKALLDQKQGSYELKTSLVKLIGIENEKGQVVITGILDDATTLLSNKTLFESKFESLNFEGNQISVFKTLLIYANVIISDHKNLTELIEKGGLGSKVQLLYRAELPKGVKTDGLADLSLYCEKDGSCAIHVPNAGYIFGGNFVDGKCHGIDCSAFVSYCVKSKVRMSTLYLDFLWREIKFGEKGFEPKELATRKELIDQWKLSESAKDFEAIDADRPLQPGDLVTWRSLNSSSGHTVIYLEPVPMLPNEFVAVEANRQDDKSMEGIAVNVFKRNKPGLRTTVLRKKM